MYSHSSAFAGLPGEMFASVDKALDERTIGHNPERLCLMKVRAESAVFDMEGCVLSFVYVCRFMACIAVTSIFTPRTASRRALSACQSVQSTRK
jgi:hypothetical protein